MVKSIDFRRLSHGAREELFRAMGLSAAERAWLRARGKPVGLVEFYDRHKVSRDQQKKAHALLQDVCRWSGYTPLETEKILTKRMFQDSETPFLGDTFSLGDCSMEVARLYITWLIDFCLLNGVPCHDPLWKLCEDIPRYVYAALLNHRCAVCGKKAELHHVDAVGMGRRRKEICHIGMRVLPLCRKHHTEIHSVGKESFLRQYMLEAIRADERIAEAYNLKGEKGKST